MENSGKWPDSSSSSGKSRNFIFSLCCEHTNFSVRLFLATRIVLIPHFWFDGSRSHAALRQRPPHRLDLPLQLGLARRWPATLAPTDSGQGPYQSVLYLMVPTDLLCPGCILANKIGGEQCCVAAPAPLCSSVPFLVLPWLSCPFQAHEFRPLPA